MLTLHLPDMSCGHCKTAVEGAVRTLDQTAALDFDMDKREVTINTEVADADVIKAVADAGYTASNN